VAKVFGSGQEMQMLRIIQKHPKSYGAHIQHLSKDTIPRGSVYSVLQRLIAQGWVEKLKDPEAQKQGFGRHPGMDRPRYQLTLSGEKMLAAAKLVQR
jgi:DNA-binding PadR family transcriptional regulator